MLSYILEAVICAGINTIRFVVGYESERVIAQAKQLIPPHIAASFEDGGNPLMVSDPVPGERQLISGLDALLLAEISSFRTPALTVPIPAPW